MPSTSRRSFLALGLSALGAAAFAGGAFAQVYYEDRPVRRRSRRVDGESRQVGRAQQLRFLEELGTKPRVYYLPPKDRQFPVERGYDDLPENIKERFKDIMEPDKKKS